MSYDINDDLRTPLSGKMLPLAILLFLLDLVAAAGNVTSSSSCSCGFLDPGTGVLYTDSIILYFNETTSVDQHVFRLQDYKNKNQRGWNTVYRQGATPANVKFGNNGTVPWQAYNDKNIFDPSLELMLDPEQFDHLSTGAQLQSLRQDIMYGTFRSEMRSAGPWLGGSAMSMFVKYNDSESAQIDLLNMNAVPHSRVMQTINGEWPTYDLAVNYSVISAGSPPKIPARNPWDFMEVRMDWTNKTMDFFVNNNQSRHVTKDDRSLPNVPSTLYLSHWSTGDQNYMEGPPVYGSTANVRWIRAFFNSSVMTESDHTKYDAKCGMRPSCSVDDMTLRGSTEYSHAATVAFKETPINQHLRDAAGWTALAFSFFGIVSIINAIIRRGPWDKIKKITFPGTKRASTQALRRSLRDSLAPQGPIPGLPYEHFLDSSSNSGIETPAPGYTSRPGNASPVLGRSGSQTPLPAYEAERHTPWQSMYNAEELRAEKPLASHPNDSMSVSARRRPSACIITPTPDGRLNLEERKPSFPMPVVHEGGQAFEMSNARNQAYYDLEGRKSPDDDDEESSYLDDDEDSQDDFPPGTAISHRDSRYGARHDSFEEFDESKINPFSSFMDLDEQQAILDSAQKSNGGHDNSRVYGIGHGNGRNPTSLKPTSDNFDPANPYPRRFDFKNRIKEIDAKKHIRFAIDEDNIPEIPDNPQDHSAAKMMEEKAVPDGVTGAAAVEPSKEQLPDKAPAKAPQQRIDYLAGLVAMSCIFVTLRHFSLTFWPYITESQGDVMHFHADRVFSWILGPYFLGPLWIGPFFVTSCRFLAQRYLKTGKLNDVANKMLLRAPRMLIPCFIFMTLEYFLISLGLTGRLEWLPSVTYSVWPYVQAQPNFGVFLNEAIELTYLTPNAAPEVINHYCVGVSTYHIPQL